MRRFIQLGVPLIAFGVMGSMALAQTQSQQAPATDHSAHHDQTGQQTEQPPAVTGGMGPGMMQGGMGPGMMQGGMGPGMMQGGMCPGMMQGGMGPGMMQGGMCPGMMQGGMGPGMTQGGMGPGMMQGGMGPGMMQGGMGPDMTQGGMGALFGSRVTPTMNLSAEDVRGYLAVQLDRLNNKRLKVGDIKADDGTITADIVTVDNSLVQRLKVDRHTGAIEYQN
jgi:hypothetical protein